MKIKIYLFLKKIEMEARILHEYFYKNDKRKDYDKNEYNHLGKNFVNILMDYENKLLMALYDYFNMKKMMTLIFDGILLFLKQNINIFDIEKYLYEITDIPMKKSIKPFEDYYKKFGEVNIGMKSFKKRYENIFHKNHKVIHHDHSKRENNIFDNICNNCNLKIKNQKELVMLFHNAKSYYNKYMLDIFSKIENIKIKVLGHNQDKFEMIEFRIPGKEYCLKIIDGFSFLQSNLNGLSKELDNEYKFITKKHFEDKFEMVNKKLENFPYDYLKAKNLLKEKLPDKKEFYNKMTLSHINDDDYNSVKKLYKDMNFKNLSEYL